MDHTALASLSCPLASSALHLLLLFNPQSFCLSLPNSTARSPYLLHPLYRFLPLSIPLQARMLSLVRGRLDSVTHHGASVRASLDLLFSSRPVCPSGLVFTELAPLRGDGKQNKKKKKKKGERLRSFLKLISRKAQNYHCRYFICNLNNSLSFFLTIST